MARKRTNSGEEKPALHHPWLVAVWPGMGNIALNAGVYLLAKLGMSAHAEFEAGQFFDVENVEVKNGIVQPGQTPRSRLFLWSDPKQRHDLVVFLGEAQPNYGKMSFCRQLIKFARDLGVERVFTFAAMATSMRPGQPSRVFGAVTDAALLEELKQMELTILQNAQIGGLNGVILAAAAEEDLPGTCLLGEMPQLFIQLPNPKASLGILEVFATIAGIELDLAELADQANEMEKQLEGILERVEAAYEANQGESPDTPATAEAPEEPALQPADHARIESLFQESAKNRAKAFELKQVLDRLGVFKLFEDRFLDLFKTPEG